MVVYHVYDSNVARAGVNFEPHFHKRHPQRDLKSKTFFRAINSKQQFTNITENCSISYKTYNTDRTLVYFSFSQFVLPDLGKQSMLYNSRSNIKLPFKHPKFRRCPYLSVFIPTPSPLLPPIPSSLRHHRLLYTTPFLQFHPPPTTYFTPFIHVSKVYIKRTENKNSCFYTLFQLK